MRLKVLALLLAGAMLSTAAEAATLISNGTKGWYNGALGQTLDRSNPLPGGGFAFPGPDLSDGDPVQDFGRGEAPDLSAAAAVLGDWLTKPARPGGAGWSNRPVHIPRDWALNGESAIIYALDGGRHGLENVLASFGIDNGVFVWLNGTFLGGQMRPGGTSDGEYELAIGDVGAGMNYLQVLREDHGGFNGYGIKITGQSVGPISPVPLPASGAMLTAGAVMLILAARRKRG